MTVRERSLFGVAFGWMLAARAMLSFSGRPLPQQQRWVDGLARALPPLPGFTVEQAVRAVTAAARRLPGSRCLAWSVALGGLLAQMRISAELRIGVAADGDGRMAAHAWLECDGVALSWDTDVSSFHVLRPRAAAR